MDDFEIEQIAQRDLRASLRQADPNLLEPVLQYLEAHSRSFRSGYTREIIWRFIRRYPLSPADLKRLEGVALIDLGRPMRREFKLMCLTMARIASPEFWAKVERLLASDTPRVRVNAYCLYAYAQGVDAGEKQRIELDSIKLQLWRQQRKQNGNIWSPRISREELIAILYEPNNWINGQVIKLAEPRQEQITGPDLERDKEFLCLDYSFIIPDIVLPKLHRVLQTGTLDIYTDSVWLLALYVIGKLNDLRAVAIVIKFLEDKIDYKYDGPLKSGVENKALAVLYRLGTAEANEAISKRRRS